MGAEASNSACPQRAFVVSLMCTICIEGPPRQFDALFGLHQKSMLIFATIALGHPKLALESFQRLRKSSRCVLSSDSSSLIYWNLGLLNIFCHNVINISGIQRTQLFSLLSAQREGLRCSRLFDYTWFYRGH